VERDGLPANIWQVVPRPSAVVPGAADGEPIAIHANHTNMVKFESMSNPGYKTVSGHLRVMTVRAGPTVGKRWDTEAKVNAGTCSWSSKRVSEVTKLFSVHSN
jgi:hypothetical protein